MYLADCTGRSLYIAKSHFDDVKLNWDFYKVCKDTNFHLLDNRSNHTTEVGGTCRQDHACWQIWEALFHQDSDQKNLCCSL